jgi:hypothetical protein
VALMTVSAWFGAVMDGEGMRKRGGNAENGMEGPWEAGLGKRGGIDTWRVRRS